MQNLKKSLSKNAVPYYVHQDAVVSRHPVMSDNPEHHHIYEAAGVMVSERHDKGDLVELVNCLLRLIHE